MAGNQAGEHEIRERRDRMERELRRWRLGALGALSLTQDRIPVLLFSESGEEKNGLTLGFGEEEGPMLQFYDSKGKKRIAIAAPPKGKPHLRFLDDQGRLLARFP